MLSSAGFFWLCSVYLGHMGRTLSTGMPIRVGTSFTSNSGKRLGQLGRGRQLLRWHSAAMPPMGPTASLAHFICHSILLFGFDLAVTDKDVFPVHSFLEREGGRVRAALDAPYGREPGSPDGAVDLARYSAWPDLAPPCHDRLPRTLSRKSQMLILAEGLAGNGFLHRIFNGGGVNGREESNCLHSPDLPKRSSTATISIGTRHCRERASATAEPKPPIRECSSAVTTQPVFRAEAAIVSSSSGFTQKASTTSTEIPCSAKASAASNASRIFHAVGHNGAVHCPRVSHRRARTPAAHPLRTRRAPQRDPCARTPAPGASAAVYRTAATAEG